jgi:radical SAM superfamily enzyme YgiQ (UPF0313 family)
MKSTKKTRLLLFLAQRYTRTHSISHVEPLGILSLAEYAGSLGFGARVYAGDIYEAYELARESVLKNSHKTVIGIYCDFENMNAVESLSRRIKTTLDAVVIVGGPQTVGLGEEFLRKSGADVLFRGEGEYALGRILNCVENDEWDGVNSIPGICMIDGDNLLDNGISPPIENLDALPIISGKLRSLKARALLQAGTIAVISGRGCPFRCAFCYEGENGKTMRRRSVASVMSEIRSRLNEAPLTKYIFFGDDTFTLDKKRVAEFCAEMKKLRKERDFVWFADAHVNAVKKSPEIVKMMVDAGLVRMQIGIESGCQNIIDIYNKNIRKEDLFDILQICKEAGLSQLVGNVIIGGALESKETLAETFQTINEMYRRGGLMFEASCTFYMPFPHTEMSRDPERFGIKVLDWQGLTSHGDYPMVETKDLTAFELVEARKKYFFDMTETMNRTLDDGAISDDEILEYYRQSVGYGLFSLWNQFALSGRRLKDTQYRARVKGDRLINDYRDGKIMDARPTRTIRLSLAYGFARDIPNASGYVFSPFEEHLLHLSSSKLTLGEVMERMNEKFGGVFQDRDELEAQVLESLEKMEKHGLCVMRQPIEAYSFAERQDERATEGVSGGPVKIPQGSNELRPPELECLRMHRVRLTEKIEEITAANNNVLILRLATIIEVDNSSGISPDSLGAYTLAAWLDAHGYDAYVCECSDGEVADIFLSIGLEKFLAIGFTTDNENKLIVKKLSRAITERYGLPVIVGGPESMALGREFLTESKAEAVVAGEGEWPLLKLLDAIRSGRRKSYADIPGLRYIDENSRYVDTGIGEIVENLDDIPFPAYDKSVTPLDFSNVRIMSGRGCPYACAFCHESTYKRRVRVRSADNVAAELRHVLTQYDGVEYISFSDDTLTADPSRLIEICSHLKRLREEFDFTVFCEADVISLSRNLGLLQVMKDSGIIRIQIGIESADPEMLRVYRKNITPEMVERVVSEAYRVGIESMFGAILVGGPFENKKHIEKNMAFAERLLRLAPGMMEVSPSIVMPYPLTAIGRNPEKFGLTITDPDLEGCLSDYPVMHSAEMSERDILQACQDFIMFLVDAAGRIIKEGAISHEILVKEFKKPAFGHRFWQHMIIHHIPQSRNFYEVLARGAGRRVEDVPSHELPGWRPQRMVEMWHDVSFKQGYPVLSGEPLSPFEFDLLKFSTGKLTIGEAAGRMYEQYGKPFGESEAEFFDRIAAQLRVFSSKYQVVAVPY